ncbi:glycerol-3-phosphate dehydrogenase [Rhizocola hellebori]|uniref:Glycerol-3-phosphate dehydrogenase n=1 Tax=Rhizocola hellebori TaxID=1392758 RepID=A0A8J3VIP7_9ACTN|nr:glycerol-3-phosphate dehydrogenase/oxidase [Rhizocola hellebori]GIH07617.1 glycerol-3-phosphate dehydrogenase [Rhizocola hellebori]
MSQRRNSSLNRARRARELQELAETQVDVLVVGLGVTGAGVALDAASRGLSVAAVDAHDLAFGTSRWSSKLVHGGLRYLAHGDVGLAYESAVERGLLMRHIAPHLVRPLPAILPFAESVSPKAFAQARAGVAAGDLLRLAARTPRAILPRPRKLSRVETLAMAPALQRNGLRGGLLAWDGQLCDDARLVVGLARAAAGFGARIITRCRAVTRETLRDELTGSTFTVRARVVVNATGVWAATLAPQLSLRPSIGSHLVLPGRVFGGLGAGLTIPVPGATSRYVLALPQRDGRVYVGLTDEPFDGPIPDEPVAPEADADFLLGVLNSVLEHKISRSDVIGSYAGLRPLLGAEGQTADLSRRHVVQVGEDGVVTVVGGKLTTYRRMAEDAVDTAVRVAGLNAGPCRTKRLPLPGAPGGVGRRGGAAGGGEAASGRVGGALSSGGGGLDKTMALLRARYGLEAEAVAALGVSEVAPGVTEGELRWGVLHEGALDEADLLERRTRAGLVPTDREAALPAAVRVLAEG